VVVVVQRQQVPELPAVPKRLIRTKAKKLTLMKAKKQRRKKHQLLIQQHRLLTQQHQLLTQRHQLLTQRHQLLTQRHQHQTNLVTGTRC
jgi:hypothetical protein